MSIEEKLQKEWEDFFNESTKYRHNKNDKDFTMYLKISFSENKIIDLYETIEKLEQRIQKLESKLYQSRRG